MCERGMTIPGRLGREPDSELAEEALGKGSCQAG